MRKLYTDYNSLQLSPHTQFYHLFYYDWHLFDAHKQLITCKMTSLDSQEVVRISWVKKCSARQCQVSQKDNAEYTLISKPWGKSSYNRKRITKFHFLEETLCLCVLYILYAQQNKMQS